MHISRPILLLLLIAAPTMAADAARPNVIVVMTDDQGYGDVGIHGNEKIRTPNLDQFARDGLQMSRFYCCPVCSPTRASLLTGRDFYRTGVIHTSRGGAKMHGDEATLAEYLAQSGYATGIFGKWHLGDNYPMRPQDQGFQEVFIHKSGGIVQPPDLPNSYFDSLLWHNGQEVRGDGYCTDVFFDKALEFIEQHRDDPFFVYLPTNAPHTPLEVDDKYVTPYKQLGLDDATARVYGMVQNIDENFGRLIARLEELKLRDNTLVVFLTDNGPQQNRYTSGLRGRKSMAYEGGIRVPCFWQGPGLPKEVTIDEPAAHIDLLPTILAACGIKLQPAKRIDGVNLWPLLTGHVEQLADRTIFLQVHRGLEPQEFHNCAAVGRRFKLVGYGESFNQEEIDLSNPPQLELYDLEADPGETKNLAAEHPEELARLRDAYRQWFSSVQAERQFEPGVIVIGSDQENPLHLCLYQDATFVGSEAEGWSVKLLHAGQYRVTARLNTSVPRGTLHVEFQGKHQQQEITDGHASGVFALPAGQGQFHAWFAAADGSQPDRNLRTVGDVEIEYLGSGQ